MYPYITCLYYNNSFFSLSGEGYTRDSQTSQMIQLTEHGEEQSICNY